MDSSATSGGAGRRREALPRTRRIRIRAEFKKAYAGGRKSHGRFVVVFLYPNGRDVPRLGVTATRKVGGAVVRNLLKRRVREICRRAPELFGPGLGGFDVVVNLKEAAAGAPFEALSEDLTKLLKRAAGNASR